MVWFPYDSDLVMKELKQTPPLSLKEIVDFRQKKLLAIDHPNYNFDFKKKRT